MNVKKIIDAIAVTSAAEFKKNPVDYNYQDLPDGGDFGISGLFGWAVDDCQLYLTDDDGTYYGEIWKVKGKKKIAYEKHVEGFKKILKNEDYLESLADFNESSIEDVKAIIEDCIENYDKYFDEKVAEAEEILNS